jgi:hypothetical protein
VSNDHVLDFIRPESSLLQQALQRGHTEVNGGQRFEYATVPADGRPNRFANNGVTATQMNLPPGTFMTMHATLDNRCDAKHWATPTASPAGHHSVEAPHESGP